MKSTFVSYRSFLPGFLLGLCFISLHSCNQTGKKNIPAEKKTEHTDTIRTKPPASFSDTLTVHFPAAVFYNPDSLQLQKIKEITPGNEYETEVHNCFYLMRNARIEMKKYWPQINIIETSKHRYLLFVKANKEKACIDLNKRGDMCGIFLFNGKKEPQFSDMMNINTDMEYYFNK